MPKTINNQYGNIMIDENVFATIAAISAMECYGLVGMASKNTTDNLVRLLKKEHLTKGVKITINDDEVNIDLFIIVQFGTKISVVADNIIGKVKYNVQQLTGVEVDKVNVYVQGVRVQKEK
ncbi:Asp23/Gls24 family envelope stress response protein [Abyssisolibacter fermentans]|uniref:Asp23/Gls24 family envelope stress response protein n=1 Tax=Abyssisolibacter fermentans TaxID=1766203 RepID=UPI00083684DF|nr:Asp23/Gls24 family envelope stress response protein [Abyssisolibacter fermentans]